MKTYKKYDYHSFIDFSGRLSGLRPERRKKIEKLMRDKFKYGKLSNEQILSIIGKEYDYSTKQKVKACLSDEINEQIADEAEGSESDTEKPRGFFSILFGTRRK